MQINALESDKIEFVSCIDGDTFKVKINSKEEKVRMLAIDTPETVKVGTPVEPYGKEASDYTCDKVKNASILSFEYEKDKYDKYDRLLAWVFVDNSLLQKELVSLGYAKVAYIYDDYKYTEELYTLESDAAELKKGIWSEEEYIKKQDNNEKQNTEKKDKSKNEEKSFLDEILDTVIKHVKKSFNKLLKDIKKNIKKLIEEIFASV